MTWDPQLYARFQRERDLPYFDLLDRVPPLDPQTVVDLGCGTGRLTATLLDRWPEAHIIGIDHSAEMLQEAPEHARLRFIHADIRAWSADEPVDLLISNAALHWLPDHDDLFPRIAQQVAPGGCLAVQMPANQDRPAHIAARDVAQDESWTTDLAQHLPQDTVLPLDDYRMILVDLGFQVDAWDTTYEHRLPGAQGIVEWLSGTTIRHLLARLPDDEQVRYRELLERRIAAAYGDGDTVRFPFRRRFLIATRPQP